MLKRILIEHIFPGDHKVVLAVLVFVILGQDQQVSWMRMRDSIHSSDPSLASAKQRD